MRGALPSATLDPQGSVATDWGWTRKLAAHYYLLLIHPLPTAWYSPLSQGEKVDAQLLQEYYEYIHTMPADCLPETGGRGANRRRGWTKPLTAHYYLLLIHPLPTAWYSPLSQGEKVDAQLLQEYYGYNFIAPADCPSETGGRGAKRRRGWIR